MKYRHKKTGVIIDVPCEIHGGEWEPETAPAQPAPAQETKEPGPKKTSRAKGKGTKS